MLVALLFIFPACTDTIRLASVCVPKKAKVISPNPSTMAQSCIHSNNAIPTPISPNVPCKSISGLYLSERPPATTEPMIPATYMVKINATQ